MNNRNMLSIIGLLVILVALPSAAWAFDFSWSSPDDDKSLFYLGQVFGPVGNALAGTGNALVASLFRIFNIAVLSLGSIVVSYTIILSTINTAQEGEVMGRKWSSIWIPLRAAVGMGFLLPTASGYSLIQVMMMQIVVYGIAAANQIWAVAVGSMSSGVGATGSVIVSGDRAGPVRQLLNAMVCAETINNNIDCKTSFSNQMASAYSKTSGNSAKLYVGIQDDNNYASICGTMQSSGGASSVEQADWIDLNAGAMRTAAGDLQYVATQIVANTGITSDAVKSALDAASNNIYLSLLAAPLKVDTGDKYSAAAMQNGWLFAGSYYFELIKEQKNSPMLSFPTGSPGSMPNTVAQACQIAISNNQSRAADLIPSGAGSGTTSTTTGNDVLTMQSNNVGGSGGPLYEAIANAVKSATVDILNDLTTGSGDPISSMRDFGSSIMTTCENLWFIIIILAFITLLPGCMMSGISPICWAIGAIITVLVPILTLIIGLLWGAGAAIGIYLPMVPYLVFTFTSLGWMLLVIETMAAAPIVALGLVSPAQENLGKASASVMLITNVFLRPSLMVIGFVVAVKLVTAAITMVNFGFISTVNASTGNIGIFGCIALICLYGGLCIGIIHECFSLVYALPDKITRWIGGQAETSTVKDSLKESKEAVDKGAEIGGGLMKSSANWAAEKGKAAMKGVGIMDAVKDPSKIMGGGGGAGGAIPGGGGGAMPGGGGGGMPGGGGGGMPPPPGGGGMPGGGGGGGMPGGK